MNHKTVLIPLLGLLALLAAPQAEAQSSPVENCEPSIWGPEDEVGAANRMTAASVLDAVNLVSTGRVYPLGITVGSDTPAFPPRGISLTVLQPNQQESARPFSNMTYNDDIISGWLGIGSQIDGLGHLGHDGVYYNCNHARDFAAVTGLTKLGLDKLPPIVARGIVLDMAAHFGVESMDAGQYFTVEDVMEVEERQGTPVREGDVVLFHTGWTDAKLESDPTAWVSGEPGQSEEVAYYLAAKNVIAVGADTWGLDVIPPQVEDRPFQGHIIYLKENGIYILETMNTGPLVRDGVHEFLFVLGHARIKGSVQMLINPVAIH